MAIPPHAAALLQKAALFDLVIGIVLAGFGLATDRTVLMVIGVALAASGLALVAVARSQHDDPDGPISS